MENLNELISDNLNALRKSRSLTLDQVAHITGVSKSMLSQIEKGKKTPTVTTLWKIATGLNVSVSVLMDTKKATVNHIKCEDITPFVEENGKYKAFPFLPYSNENNFEVFQMHIAPNSEYKAKPHSPGIKEYIFVSEGTLDIKLQDNTYSVSQNESFMFPGDINHIYSNKLDTTVKAFVLITYPK